MTAKIIDGSTVSREMRVEIKAEVTTLKEKYCIVPGIGGIIVGDDPASQVYFGQKEKALVSLQRVIELDPTDGLAMYNCACTYAVIGDRERSLQCLKRAFANGYNYVREWVKSDPDFAAFCEDSEFKAFVA